MEISGTAYRLLLVGLIGALALASCRDVDEITSDGLWIISGTVTDSVTGMPIDSALVNLDDTSHSSVSVYTDTLGEYQIVMMAAARHVVFCRKNGYRTKWLEVPKQNDNDIVNTVNFQLAL